MNGELSFNESKSGNDYRVCWEGYVDVEKTDSIRSFVDAQGAYRLWIDGTLALDASQSQSFDVRNTAISAKRMLNIFGWSSATNAVHRQRSGWDMLNKVILTFLKRNDWLPKPICGFLCWTDGSIELEGRLIVLSTCLTDKIC